MMIFNESFISDIIGDGPWDSEGSKLEPYLPADNPDFNFWCGELRRRPDLARRLLEKWFTTLPRPEPPAFFQWAFLTFYRLRLPGKLLAQRLEQDFAGAVAYLKAQTPYWDSETWSITLADCPQLADVTNIPWSRFSVDDWIQILSDRPEFAGKCRIFERFDGSAWRSLLVFQPGLAVHCRQWDMFSEHDWMTLIYYQRCFLNHPACTLSPEIQQRIAACPDSQ